MGKQRWIDGISRSIEEMLAAAARAPVGFAAAESIGGRLERIDETWDHAARRSEGASDREIAADVIAETFGISRPDALVLEQDIGAVSTAGRAVSAVVAEVGDALELENRVAEAARDAVEAVRAATEGLPEPERRRLEESAVASVAGRAGVGAGADPGLVGIEAARAAEEEARRIERELALERSREESVREENEARRLALLQMILLGLTLSEALEQVRRQELVREQERRRDEEMRLELGHTNERSRGLLVGMGF